MKQYIVIFLFFGSFMLNAQYTTPEKGYVFDDSVVPRVDILIAPDSLDRILDENNLNSNHEYPATFVFTKNNMVDTVQHVGFRLRGNTSRAAAKKSFKVSFNSFVRGQRFDGIEKMNLNGEANDPSIMRSKLCWDMYNWAEVPASRSNHVAFYINGEYKGLYLNVEHIDEEFIDKRLPDNSGNLYKCLWPADLHYRGDDPNLYKEAESWGRQAYQLKTNLETNDYSDLAHFIEVLNFWVGSVFQCELERIFDVDSYLKIIALDILTGNWDGPIVNKNNFYLYHDPCSDRFVYLPYDLDNTLGIDWFGIDWANTDIYNWSSYSGDYRPIFEKIMAVPEYQDRFSYYMRTIIENHFNSEVIQPYLSEKKNLLASFRNIDTYAALDYGWNATNWFQSFDESLGDHVKYGLTDYMAARASSAIEQLDTPDIIPVVQHIEVDWSPNEVIFDLKLLDDQVIETAVFHYKMGEQDWQSESLNVVDNTAQFSFTTDEIDVLTYYVEVTDNIGQNRDYPMCQDATLLLGYHATPQLVINELLASNDTGASDNAGEFEDWIELYNADDAPLELSDFYLSDNSENPTKWRLPNETLYPGEYFIIWADDDTDQGSHHANFKLNKGGEFLGLFDQKSNHHAVMDSLTFPEQQTDISYARQPNGTGDFGFDDSPTFNMNNDILSSVQNIQTSAFTIYPNPVSTTLFIDSNTIVPIDIQVFDTKGQLLLEQDSGFEIDVSQFINGVYFIKINGIYKRFIVQK